jgi:hypothetical protein
MPGAKTFLLQQHASKRPRVVSAVQTPPDTQPPWHAVLDCVVVYEVLAPGRHWVSFAKEEFRLRSPRRPLWPRSMTAEQFPYG